MLEVFGIVSARTTRPVTITVLQRAVSGGGVHTRNGRNGSPDCLLRRSSLAFLLLTETVVERVLIFYLWEEEPEK